MQTDLLRIEELPESGSAVSPQSKNDRFAAQN